MTEEARFIALTDLTREARLDLFMDILQRAVISAFSVQPDQVMVGIDERAEITREQWDHLQERLGRPRD